MSEFKSCYYNYLKRELKDEIFNKIVPLIEKTLNFEVQLPTSLRINKLKKHDYRYILNRWFQLRGGYDHVKNIITLYDGKYCRKTVIHEVFHALSFFAYGRFSHLFDRLRLMIEGLTEFLTGYILYENYRECYEEWIRRRYKVCRISYESETRLFGALARYVNLKELAGLYLWQANTDWYKIYKEFRSKHGIKEVLFVKRGKEPLEKRVLSALCEAFGSEILILAEDISLRDCLDYSQMNT